MEKNHGNKMIAPIVIGIIVILYMLFYFGICTFIPMPAIGKIILGLVFIILAGVMIFVLWERIKEIRSGEEDDLSQY